VTVSNALFGRLLAGGEQLLFDASTGAPWPKLAVIRPNEPLRLKLRGALEVSNRQLPTVTVALATLFAPPEHQNGRLRRKFDSISSLMLESYKNAGESAKEFEYFLYGMRTGTISSNPWSEKEEAGYSRIILRLSTASDRTYRSSPGLLIGSNPAYSVREVTRQ
jgi:hypothetical protein